ncbi:putative cation efflux system transmembrane protein [Desulfurispirillum indicum S5]|uniref:Putative cation efflux system transmembrane protein n=1 Tax=Desulfurispirillum indicum (strain ATCC BAA-1389 / DSM 22839 / S5) TaxID=653733 RepID=E6W4R7_DESIS|nr:copper-binding protein [Desulfurispirillum indicum]ADU64795.1 putative cation efflux system transmembrane protein [Desulfurispirillum indicum S5]
MKKSIIAIIAAVSLLSLTAAITMASSHGHGNHGHSSHGSASGAIGSTVSANGEVIALDPTGRTITLHHEPIRALRWPAMTMELDLENPSIAEGLAEGDRIVFDLKRLTETDYLITGIRKR